MKIKQKKIVVDIIFGICIPVIIAVLLLSPILFSAGITFYGDEVYYNKWYLPGFFSSQLDALSAWVSGTGPNSILTLPQYSLPLTVFEVFFDQSIAVKLLLILMASLPAMSTYIAIRVLLALGYNGSSPKHCISFERVAAFVGGLIMMLSFTNNGLTQWGASMLWPYAMLPLSFAFFAKFLKSGRWGDVLITSLATVIASTQPFGLYLFLIATTPYLLIELFDKKKILLIRRATFTLALILLFNAFWLVPMSAGYLLGAGGFFATYTTEKLISFEGLFWLSCWKVLHLLIIGNPHAFFLPRPFLQDYGPLHFIIPIFASLSIIKFRRNKHVLHMALILVIGVFLTKGAWEPGGYLYYLIASHLPYGAGALMRNPMKFVSLVIFPYSFLVSLFISYVYERLPSLKFRFVNIKKVKLKALFRYGVLLGLVALVLSPITYGTILVLQGYTWPRFKPSFIPNAYNDVNSWLSSQKEDFKVLWLGGTGSGGYYWWKDGYPITGFPEGISSKPSVSSAYVWPDLLKNTNNTGQLLSILGVKYLIFHSDDVYFPHAEAYTLLNSQKDLKLEQSFEMPPLGLEREVLLRVNYRLPEPVIEAGYEHLMVDFNLRMAVFPLGDPLGKKVLSKEMAFEDFWNLKTAESFAFNETFINEHEGHVDFKLTVVSGFEDLGLDIYLNYYTGGFRSISPVYYLGSLKFDNAAIYYEQNPDVSRYFNATMVSQRTGPKTAGIYVFKNTNPAAQIYASPQLIYVASKTSSFSELIEMPWFDPSKYAIFIDQGSFENRILNYSTMIMMHGLDALDRMNQLNETERPVGWFNEFDDGSSLFEHEILLQVRYSLPEEVSEAGYKGQFSNAFNIRMAVFPSSEKAQATEMPFDAEFWTNERSAECFALNQTLINEREGYVNFNLTVVSGFGDSLDIYLNYYDGGFKSISPVYYLGSLVFNDSSIQFQHNNELGSLFNATIGGAKSSPIRKDVSIIAPKSDEYLLALRSDKEVNISYGEEVIPTVRASGNWQYFGPIMLQQGVHEVGVSSCTKAHIYSVALLPSNFELQSENSAVLAKYERVSPVEWRITGDASSPFVITLTEPYDPLWRAYVNGKEIEPIKLYDTVNGFYIEDTGLLRIKIYYKLQDYFNLGYALSLITAVIVVTSITFNKLKFGARLKGILRLFIDRILKPCAR
jgi:hypothetical protein